MAQLCPSMVEVERDGIEFVRMPLAYPGKLRLPGLFGFPGPDAAYFLRERNGLTVIALRTPNLSADQLLTIRRYWSTQNRQTGVLESEAVRATGDPSLRSMVSPDDLHVIAGSPDSGAILGYTTLRALPGSPIGITMRTRGRALFPVEQAHGWGIYNRLRVLPDLPVAWVRELGRIAVSVDPDGPHEFAMRVSVELGLAVARLLTSAAGSGITAVIGELGEQVAGASLEYLHCPTVFIRNTGQCGPADAFAQAYHREGSAVPFALLSDDLAAAAPRLAAIEQALELPGERGIAALLELKRIPNMARSCLMPDGPARVQGRWI